MSEPAPNPLNPPREVRGIVPHFVLLLASAILLALSFPRPGIWFLAHVALVPMFVLALRAASSRRLLWTGFVVGWAWWLVMIRWMIPVTVGGWIGLSGYMALYTPLALVLVRLLHRRLRLPATLALPLVWVSLEYIRCHGLEGGFAWFVLGHSQGPIPDHSLFHAGAPALIQIADLFGQHGVSVLVAMTNGLLLDLLVPRFRRVDRQLDSSKAAPNKRWRPDYVVVGSALLWGGCIVFTWLYGWVELNHGRQLTEGGAKALEVAVIQTNVPQDNKDSGSPEQRLADWQRMLKLTVEAARDGDGPGPDLIVWPETMVPHSLNAEARGYGTRAGLPDFEEHETISRLARSLDTALLVGGDAGMDFQEFIIQGESYILPSRRYNSAYLYHADGTQDPLRYDKVHRVPFGEYVPWTEGRPRLRKLFFKYLSPYGDFDYSIRAGEGPVHFELPAVGGRGPVRFATPICFEDAMPHLCREMVYDADGRKRADVLINLTNDGWFAGTDQPLQQFQIAAFRCVENRVPMARSVNTGISGFLDSSGRITHVVEVGGRSQDVEGFARETLRTDPRLTLFGRIGHMPIHAMMILTAGLVLFSLLPRKRA